MLGAAIAVTAAHGEKRLASALKPATPTPIPVPFRAALTGPQRASDAASGLQARMREVRITLAAPAAKKPRLFLDVEVQLHNALSKPRSFDAGSLYLVVTGGSLLPGTTLAAQAPSGLPRLGRGVLNGESTRTGWVSFPVPARPERYVIIWSDDDRLATPATVAGIVVQATSASGS